MPPGMPSNQLAQRAFTDQEWERVRARLLEYVVILRHWRRQIPAHKQARADNVVSMPEPGTSESLLDKAA